MSTAGVRKITLNDLTPHSVDFLIVGVIIAKATPHTFLSKKDGLERAVWGFTLRDSSVDYINVTVWGSVLFIETMSTSYRVGDVGKVYISCKCANERIVDLINTRVSVRKPGDNDFKPEVTSCLELTFIENASEIRLHDEDDCISYIQLLHLPTKPQNNFLRLADVKTIQLFNNQDISLLVAVQKVGEIRVFSKDGKEKSVLEIVVMDKSSNGFPISIWDADMIERAKNWKPRDTILFLADIQVKWDNYRSTTVGVIGRKSVVTENPNTKEAMALAQFSATVPMSTRKLDAISYILPPPEMIINVMSCDSIINRAKGNGSEMFTALVYATMHAFDIDGAEPIVHTKCNSDCYSKPGSSNNVVSTFDFKVSFGDHTNLLPFCQLTGKVAEDVLGCSVEQFNKMADFEKTQLKWKYLLKKVAAKLVILSGIRPEISVVAIEKVTHQEYSLKVPVC